MRRDPTIEADKAIREAAVQEFLRSPALQREFATAEAYGAYKAREFVEVRAGLADAKDHPVPASLEPVAIAKSCVFIEDIEPAAKAAFGQSLTLQREFAHRFESYLALCRHEFTRKRPRPRMAVGGRH